MIVESLVLGKYKDLAIDKEVLKAGKAEIDERIKFMVSEKANEMGLEMNSGTIIMLDDDTAKGLYIEGIHSLTELEIHVDKVLMKENLINTVMRQVLDQVRITYNEKEVAEELEKMMFNIERQAKEEGFTLEFFCSYNGIADVMELRSMYTDEIRTSYLEVETLKAIAEAESLAIDTSEYEEIKRNFLINHDLHAIEDEEAFRIGLLCQRTVNWLVNTNC